MTDTPFGAVPFSVRQLVDNIKRGDVALPDIQRPFVWQNRKVRDLFDSMVKGFPVGRCAHLESTRWQWAPQ